MVRTTVSGRFMHGRPGPDDVTAHLVHVLTAKFVHHVIDGMCGGIAVSQEMYKDCPLDKFWLAVQQVKTVAHDIALGKLSKEKVISWLLPLGQEKAEQIYEIVMARKGELVDALLRESLKNTHHLKDFDWNVRLAIASDKVLDLNECLLTLHLHTSPKNMKGTKDLCVEMTATQADSLLNQLKDAQKVLAELPPE
ncbi:COMM domain-containing protein 8-like isoform X2 [Procambarus clarkii]|uniref:COMM domain-containing protein 8-like isoform X2 n=1 Tax=Procambarus clarkii TaxID=6728 RepID=UPI0037446CF8